MLCEKKYCEISALVKWKDEKIIWSLFTLANFVYMRNGSPERIAWRLAIVLDEG